MSGANKRLGHILALFLAAVLLLPSTLGLTLQTAQAAGENTSQEGGDTPPPIPEQDPAIIANPEEVLDIVDENGEKILKGFNTDDSYEGKKLYIPEGVTKIADWAFSGLLLKYVSVPGSVKVIGNNAFAYCTELEAVDILYGAETIYNGAFQYCTALKRLSLPPTIKTLDGKSIFAVDSLYNRTEPFKLQSYMKPVATADGETATLIETYVKDNSDAFASIEDLQTSMILTVEGYDADTEVIYDYELSEDGQSVTIKGYHGYITGEDKTQIIPPTIGGKPVTAIADGAFATEDSKELKAVDIPDSVKKIGDNAFPAPGEGEDKIKVNIGQENNELSDWVLKNQDKVEVPRFPMVLKQITLKAAPPKDIAAGVNAVDTFRVTETTPYEIDDNGNVTDGKTQTLLMQEGDSRIFRAGTEIEVSVVPIYVESNEMGYRFVEWTLTVPDTVTDGQTHYKDATNDYMMRENTENTKLPTAKLTIPENPSKDLPFDAILTAGFEEVTAEPPELKYVEGKGFVVVDYTGIVIDPQTGNAIVKPDFELKDEYFHQEDQKNYKVYKIGDEATNGGVAFRDGGLKTLSIGSGVTEILPQAFDEAYGLEAITVRGRDNPADVASMSNGYYTRDGVLFRKYTNESGNVEYELCSYPKGKQVDGAYQIPSEVTGIGPWAFNGRMNLTGVEINNNLRMIGGNAFAGSGLKSINIPNTVTEVDNSAFAGCESLTSVSISHIETVGTGVFKGCTSLTIVDIDDDVTEIQDEMFMDCTLLSAVDFNKVQTIGESAFANTGLSEILLPASVGMLNAHAFEGCGSLIKATLMNPHVQFGTGSDPGVFANCAGVDENGKQYPVLSSYRGSTTQVYANEAANNHPFEPIQTADCRQVVVDLGSGSRDWISISILDENGIPVAGCDKVTSAEAEPGSQIRVNVKRLQDGLFMLDHITVYELDETLNRGEGKIKNALMMVAASNNRPREDGKPFTVDDVTFTFTMGAADIDIVATIKEQDITPVPAPPEGVPGESEELATADATGVDENTTDVGGVPVDENETGSSEGTGTAGGSGGSSPSGSDSETNNNEETGSDGNGGGSVGGETSSSDGGTESGGSGLTGDFDNPLPEPERPATYLPGTDNTEGDPERDTGSCPIPGSPVEY